MIPVCTPLLGKKEKKYLLDCINTNWISSAGKYIKKFEEDFSQYCGTKYGITTTSGTSALHLAVRALDIGPGDEVIMPSFTIASCAFAVIYCGAKPVFVDSEPLTWNMDVSQIEAKITKRTKAIMPVHIYGHPCDMDAIMKLARQHRLSVIEDAAEAHGATYRNKKVGGIGHIGCFSFYGNKIITCGEGGMVTTNNKRLANRCRSFKNLVFQPQKRFWHDEVGFNYRMTNMQAAVGLAQFEDIDKLIEKRRKNGFLYTKKLSKIPGIICPVEKRYVRNVYWMYGIVLEKSFGCSRDQLMQHLRARGIETRTFFIPLHQQPVLKKMGVVSKVRLPVCERIGRQGLYLPSGSGLARKEINYIVETIAEIQNNL